MAPVLEIEENPEDIDELRQRLHGSSTTELQEDDNIFVRFLRARNHNIDAAETMLKKHLVWRKTNKIDSLLKDYEAPEMMMKYFTLDHISYSHGYPVLFCNLGSLDTRGLLKSCSVGELMTNIAWILEKTVENMKVQTEKMGRLIDQLIIIVNIENLSLSTVTHKATIEAVISIIQMYDLNYPERLKTAYVINANSYFMMMWSLVRPFLTGRTFQKIRIFGKTNYQETLLKELDRSSIPASIGGTLTDPDGCHDCKTLITFGGPIPERYYKNTEPTRLPNSTKLCVQRMSKAEVEIHVERVGSTIEWEFESGERDIYFSVVRKSDKADGDVEVLEKQKIQTLAHTESGILKCYHVGTYVLQFDNKYSWFHSKEINYIISVKDPAPEP